MKRMPVVIETIRYFSAAELAKELRVSRTTFWRWRSEHGLPAGRKYRGGKMVLFTDIEVQAYRSFANRIEPIEGPNLDQMKLFNEGH